MFTPNAGYTGTASFNYVARDASGAMATAKMTVTVLSASARLTRNSTGQLEVTGGLGGVGYFADARSGASPDATGNFRYVVTASESSWSRVVPIGGVQQTATGPQSISLVVKSEYKDSSNWSYVEAVSWTYTLGASDASGNVYAAWGGYGYTFAVNVVAGVKTTSYTYDATDSYRTTARTLLDGGSDTTFAEGTDVFHLDVGNIDRPTTPDSGWHNQSTHVTSSDSSVGTFSYPLEGGSVTGDLFGQGANSSTSAHSIAHSQDSSGVWSASGMTAFEGRGDRTAGGCTRSIRRKYGEFPQVCAKTGF